MIMNEITLKAFAKINLGLDVLRKREDGYHEVRMIMQNIRLFDRIELVRTKEEGFTLTSNLKFLPSDGRNLMVKAAALMFDTYKLPGGLKMVLEKRIPVAAGMAGGSTDAAAVMHGINRIFELKEERDTLMKLGKSLGADVPYCIMRKTALAEGIGEILTELPSCPDCTVVLAKPAASASTKIVYESLVLDEHTVHPDIDGMMDALQNQDLQGVCRRMGNVLEGVTENLVPEVRLIREFMKENGALNAMMTGSGPTVFGIFNDDDAARRCSEKLREEPYTRMTRTVSMLV